MKPPWGSAVLAVLVEWRYQRRLLAFHGRITELCLPLITARRRRPRNDDNVWRSYVDSLIQLRVPEGSGGRRALSDDEVVDLVLEFLGAGTASTVACLEWTLAHLVAQPDIQKKLRREVDGKSQPIRGMPYLHAVILESLRMNPPVPLALR
jgi:cytochrome P450